MTPAQHIALQRIASGDTTLHGHAVRVARSLEELGFVKLTDYGHMRGRGVDHERWVAEVTPEGREKARRGAP